MRSRWNAKLGKWLETFQDVLVSMWDEYIDRKKGLKQKFKLESWFLANAPHTCVTNVLTIGAGGSCFHVVCAPSFVTKSCGVFLLNVAVQSTFPLTCSASWIKRWLNIWHHQISHFFSFAWIPSCVRMRQLTRWPSAKWKNDRSPNTLKHLQPRLLCH